MKQERVEAYENLKQKIETAVLKKEFANKKEILLKMAAVCTGMCEDPKTCKENCPLRCSNTLKN